MTTLLKVDETLFSEASDMLVHVRHYIGSGGQGEVYCAEWQDRSVALKCYFPHQSTPEQRRAIQTLIRFGMPNSRFLWPIELASSPDKPGFGYLMPLRDPQYRSIVDLMKRRTEPSFYTLATTGIELAHSFLQLHSKGLCYRDVSFGNVFFHPETGAVLICDNDNVTVNGDMRSGVLGTPRFMAPEVVRREAFPDTQTDLFSLSVLLFYLLMVHHPLEGKKENEIKCLDLPAMNRLYGEEPLFIFDPVDDRNAPVPGFHDNALVFWPLYPKFLQRLFTRAFTEGLHKPGRRVRESEWRAALGRLRDSLFHCECGEENFFCLESYRDLRGYMRPCWACGKKLTPPMMLKVGRSQVMLNLNSKLYPHHLHGMGTYDFADPIGEVSQNPRNPEQWGLKNLSGDNWILETPEGEARLIPPGRSFQLNLGNRIDFGGVCGEIASAGFML